jgi:hypothetical protein
LGYIDKEEVMGKRVDFDDIRWWSWERPRVPIVLFFILLLAIGITYISYYVGSQEIVTGTIESTVVDRGNTYFVFQLDDGTREIFENEDSFSFWKFNSGNLLMELKAGNSYQVLVAGWRVPFFSVYRNIITILERR